MNISYTYLLINLGAIIVPFLFSFHPKLEFNKEWRRSSLAIGVVGLLFVAWDVYYTHLGVWGFTSDYLIGWDIINLPIEEVLFFICIPYACLFTYHCFRRLVKPFELVSIRWVSIALLTLLLTGGIFYLKNLYTGVTFLALFLLLGYVVFIKKPQWLPRFYLTLLVLTIPFTIVNGLLTGMGLETQVVWYNAAEIIGVRFITIPIEDFFYGFLLILLNVLIFEK
jgi:lycopene cyclase domain-containing protein